MSEMGFVPVTEGEQEAAEQDVSTRNTGASKNSQRKESREEEEMEV